MHFLDTELAAYLTGWTSPQALEAGAMSGQFFEIRVFGEIYKSFLDAGQRTAPLLPQQRQEENRSTDGARRHALPHRGEENGVALAQRRAQPKRHRPGQCARRGVRTLDVQT